jgi:aldehyde:ferredoxin oxidoreductase
MFAYHQNYLRIDVAAGRAERRPIGEDVLRRFLGGSGLGTWLLTQEDAARRTSPAESPLAFVFSPLVGSPLTTSAKFAVVSKSPLTARLNDSLASSGFALGGKQTGSDAILLTGAAPAPSVVLVDNGRVAIEPAGDAWEADCGVAQDRLRDRYGADFHFAVIGPAGERQVRFATLSHDGRHAGRGGSGAILGAKNVKAVGVRGDQRCQWADPERLRRFAKDLSRRSLGPATAKYRELGTAANLMLFNRLKTLPTKNFQLGSSPAAAALSPESLEQTRQRTRAYCAACTIGCEHVFSMGDNADDGVRVEYESLFALGPLCGIEDPDVVLAASKLCDQLGLDTISTGGTIAFAMECAERGWLDADWLRFGDGAALLRAIRETACRDGLGARLAEGSRHMAQRMGHQAMDIAPHVKGLEIPGYEPRGLQTMALGLAVGTRGADHNRSSAYEADFSNQTDRRRLTPEAARLAVESEDRAALMDSLIICKFLRGVFEDFVEEAAEMLQMVTGWNVTGDELATTARRIVSAKKQFNIRAGWTPAEDTLPRRMLEQPLGDDPHARLRADQLQAAVLAYNQYRGWTSEGWVPDRLLAELQISDL